MEGDAGTGRPNPRTSRQHPPRTKSWPRLGGLRGWAASILVVAPRAVGGYLVQRANDRAEALARSNEPALQAAKECVAATHMPGTAAMTASQSKILECSTGDLGVQAGLFASGIAEACETATATVAVDELRAAVDRHNDDGSIDVLVPLRVEITDADAAYQQLGYRLRASMPEDECQHRIARLYQDIL